MRSACQHLSNILNDVRDGVLTLDELRAKTKEVENGMTGVPEAHDVARKALAAVTRNDPSAWASHVDELGGHLPHLCAMTRKDSLKES